ncbi:FecCD family ABC transporter permease [Sporomusa aerivorans]|uniref:FecCD family ABC transporter permease n=1 Tax=Sporomusa aerivorans TaxID=204936 RepID=UPI00352A525F
MVNAKQPELVTNKNHKQHSNVLLILGSGIAALLLGIVLALSTGAADIPLATVGQALVSYDPNSTPHQIIHDLRMPRIAAGALVGAAFAVAGAIMQGMTRNPLADPGLLGINAGASFALALCFAFFPALPFDLLILYSFAGAAASAALVYGIGSLAKGGLNPLRLTLAGTAVASLFIALSGGIAIYYRVDQDLAFWYAGGIAGIKWLQVKMIFPWILAGLIGSLILSRFITLLSLGEEVATGLGLQVGVVKFCGILLVLILAGASVSTAGSIGFVGLVIPHIARYLVGADYRWIIPCSAVLGSLLLVLADIGARLINPPNEAPIGAIITLLGAPFFLYLARRQRSEI